MTPVNPSNVAAVRAAYAAGDTAAAIAPSVYVVEVTNRCNVNCIMCPQSSINPGRHRDLTTESAVRLADWIAPYAELVMLYFMGEPTLNADLDEIIDIFRSRIAGRLVLSTNAVALRDEDIRLLTDGRLDLLIACIDRWDGEAYEGIRRGATFDEVVANVEALAAECRATTTELLVKALDIKMPLEERERFVVHWEAHGARALVGWLDTWAGQRPNLAKLASTNAAPYAAEERNACADLWFKMVINVNEDVVLCCHDWNSMTVLGSALSGQSVHQVWGGRELQRLRQEHAQRNFGCHKLCRGCREWGEFSELDAYLSTDAEGYYLVF